MVEEVGLENQLDQKILVMVQDLGQEELKRVIEIKHETNLI